MWCYVRGGPPSSSAKHTAAEYRQQQQPPLRPLCHPDRYVAKRNIINCGTDPADFIFYVDAILNSPSIPTQWQCGNLPALPVPPSRKKKVKSEGLFNRAGRIHHALAMHACVFNGTPITTPQHHLCIHLQRPHGRDSSSSSSSVRHSSP